MSILPLSTPSTPLAANSFPSRSTMSSRFPLMFRRLYRLQHMDFELAAWQLTYLCLAPKRVYRNVYYHKQTKNTWARDDPAILVLLGACLVVSALLWSIVWYSSPFEALRLAFLMIFRDYLLVGVILATFLWLFSNNVLLSPPSHATPADTAVEWAYAFDVHTNAFFPFYLMIYIAQLLLVPIILQNNWICIWAGNTLYLVGFSQYVYGVYLGLNALPFLIRTELLLFPLLPLFAAYVVSLLGFNVAQSALALYFGQ